MCPSLNRLPAPALFGPRLLGLGIAQRKCGATHQKPVPELLRESFLRPYRTHGLQMIPMCPE